MKIEDRIQKTGDRPLKLVRSPFGLVRPRSPQVAQDKLCRRDAKVWFRTLMTILGYPGCDVRS